MVLLKPIFAMFTSLAGLMLASPVNPAANTAPVSQAEWKSMLARARNGGVIELGRRPVAFAGQVFQPSAPVTIRGGVFGPIELDHWRNVTFDGGRFNAPTGIPDYQSLIVAYQPEKLTIRNCHFTGYQTDTGELRVRGPSIRDGHNVIIEHSTFERMTGNAAFVRTIAARFLDNEMRGIREGLQVQGGSDIRIERNRFEDFRPSKGDHPDAVQFFTTGLKGSETAARDVTISDNLILGGGTAQGVFITDGSGLGPAGRGYQRITIEDNIVIGAAWHGITADGVDGLTIRNNRLFRRADVDTMDSRITAGGSNVAVEGNDANAFIMKGPVSQARNKKTGDSKPAQVQAVIADWVLRFRKS